MQIARDPQLGITAQAQRQLQAGLLLCGPRDAIGAHAELAYFERLLELCRAPVDAALAQLGVLQYQLPGLIGCLSWLVRRKVEQPEQADFLAAVPASNRRCVQQQPR